MDIKLTNNLSKRTYFFENLVENSNSTDLFICLDIQLPEGIEDGEYSLILYDNGVAISHNLCQIGDYEPLKESYNNDTENSYIIYE